MIGHERWAVRAVLLAVALALAGCSDLSDLGKTSSRWIEAAPSVTTTTAPAGPLAPTALRAIGGTDPIEWVNDDLGEPPTARPEDAIAAVWARSNKTDRFVQASRAEIAGALPGLEVPELVPSDVRYVSSQLIFDPSTGRLAVDSAAAFGYWSVPPYSRNRSVGQRAVLIVAREAPPSEPATDEPEDSAEAEPGDRCEELTAAGVSECSLVAFNGCIGWALDVTDGWRLVWAREGYQYDLFVREAVDAELLEEMAGSCDLLGRTAG